MTRSIAGLALALGAALGGACGGTQPQPADPGPADPPGVVEDTRTPFEKRLDAACKALEPKIVACTVADSKAELDAGRITAQVFEESTAPPILDKLAQEWEEKCDRRQRTSRQVRVLEVCFEAEPECAPLLDCLKHFDQPE